MSGRSPTLCPLAQRALSEEYNHAPTEAHLPGWQRVLVHTYSSEYASPRESVLLPRFYDSAEFLEYTGFTARAAQEIWFRYRRSGHNPRRFRGHIWGYIAEKASQEKTTAERACREEGGFEKGCPACWDADCRRLGMRADMAEHSRNKDLYHNYAQTDALRWIMVHVELCHRFLSMVSITIPVKHWVRVCRRRAGAEPGNMMGRSTMMTIGRLTDVDQEPLFPSFEP
ncbi:hypothetical protein EsDP_00004721 [Epichloe bromicola]|uniref:Uncharacterized protein n=1 Tax=Epichloe bromicola TaxID=79588 RepID=A0ABQ0CSN3_9HYPO